MVMLRWLRTNPSKIGLDRNVTIQILFFLDMQTYLIILQI